MRLDVEPSAQLVPPPVLNTNTPLVTEASTAKDYLNAGVRAANAGDRVTARAMLLRSSELDADNPNVWLWLASISEYPEELLTFVDKVLDIDPYNDRALKWRMATCSLLAKTFVQRGNDATVSDQPMYAEDCFAKALEYDPKNTTAMMWLASLTKDTSVRLKHLHQIIELEPAHEAANNALKNIAVEEEKAEFTEIRRVAGDGDVNSAVSLLHEFTRKHAENVEAWMLLSHFTVEPTGKIAALRQVLEIDPENQVAKASLDSLSSIFGVFDSDAEPESPAFDEPFDAPPVEAASVVECEEIASPNVEEFPILPPAEDLVFEPAIDETGHISQANQIEAEADSEFQNPEWQPVELAFENDWDRRTEAYEATDPAAFESSEDFTVDYMSLDEISSIPMPVENLDEQVMNSERTGFETTVESTPAESAVCVNCPYCSAQNDESAFVCRTCSAVLTLSDLESLIDNKNADSYLIRKAVDAMEAERTTREFSETELMVLGIGHLNLRNLQFGYDRLQEASKLNPNNVVLSSYANSLLIRMDEICRQDEAHAAMVTGKKILVVDDSPTIRKLITGKLEKCGHEVFLSTDGIDALEQLNSLTPDLILLDITMPNLDGYEVCRQIRGRSSIADVPVVMISGKDGYFDKMRGRLAGSTGYITKPFGPETLMKAIEFYLGGGSDADVEFAEQEVEVV